ncbi:rab-GTPase-TBC domain-containing protein [Mucor mucedo]|uniref:rab-GTPase-TBC domain-containing protein n=1 Tax=Mucor mucedo TaxID=29922 RepID=UPI00222022CF|nr:rab-GTPase-TBC domain-containing protein [Mucor mucedo]KAI7888019.1 rab-GTPase-TBC domain-containing protein [Mucor mucedo]
MNASKPSIWLELANAQEKVHHLPRQDSSQLTTASSDTDLTHITTTTSSIRTAPPSNPRKSTSSSSIQKRESDIRLQYNQRPEKVPDIAAEMEKWYATTDRYIKEGLYCVVKSKFNNSLWTQEKEVERSEKWADMSEVVLLHNDQVHSFPFSQKFKLRVFKGIPYCWKRDAWYFLITHCLKEAKSDYKLCSLYRDLLSKESSHERQIDLDIPRTLGDHIMFKQRYGKGQRALFNVLRAFSKFDEEVGYCQGMTNIVATILMYCEEEVNTYFFF